MVNSISSSSPVTPPVQVQQNHNPQTQKNAQGDQQPQDTVVLSKQATGAGDVDHDGDSH
jgi:hypothetical protein